MSGPLINVQRAIYVLRAVPLVSMPASVLGTLSRPAQLIATPTTGGRLRRSSQALVRSLCRELEVA